MEYFTWTGREIFKNTDILRDVIIIVKICLFLSMVLQSCHKNSFETIRHHINSSVRRVIWLKSQFMSTLNLISDTSKFRESLWKKKSFSQWHCSHQAHRWRYESQDSKLWVTMAATRNKKKTSKSHVKVMTCHDSTNYSIYYYQCLMLMRLSSVDTNLITHVIHWNMRSTNIRNLIESNCTKWCTTYNGLVSVKMPAKSIQRSRMPSKRELYYYFGYFCCNWININLVCYYYYSRACGSSLAPFSMTCKHVW